jgi:hypothetical protein
MGLTIDYKHGTKDLNKIKRLIQDLKQYAEATGRNFKVFENQGYSRSNRSETHMLNGSIEVDGDGPYDFSFVREKSQEYRNAPPTLPSREIGFEIELKNPANPKTYYSLRVAWHKRGDLWIANDWTKYYGPSTDETKIIPVIIEHIAFLEYIQDYYFPNFHIKDEFDFHVNYDELSDSQKQYWKDIKTGKIDSYRRADGSFPDYEAEYKSLKNHDIQNIYRSIGSINKVFGMIEAKLKQAGWKDDQIKKNVAVGKSHPEDISKVSVRIGNKMVEELHDNIRKYAIRKERPVKIVIKPSKLPIFRTQIRRQDGVLQHYHKRLPAPRK